MHWPSPSTLWSLSCSSRMVPRRSHTDSSSISLEGGDTRGWFHRYPVSDTDLESPHTLTHLISFSFSSSSCRRVASYLLNSLSEAMFLSENTDGKFVPPGVSMETATSGCFQGRAGNNAANLAGGWNVLKLVLKEKNYSSLLQRSVDLYRRLLIIIEKTNRKKEREK